jgi:hypothetical protein
MLCSFSTDIVVVKIQCGECLYYNIVVKMWLTRREVLLPHCFVMHEQDVVSLQHRYRSDQDSVWWVSVLKHISWYVIDEKRTLLTTLFCNAWAKLDSFGKSPLPIDSSVNVYTSFQIERRIWETSAGKRFLRITIHLVNIRIFNIHLRTLED